MSALTDLATLKEHLGITGSNPSDTTDAYLTALVARAGSFVEGVVGRTLLQTTLTEYHDGGAPTIELRGGPAFSVLGVPQVTLKYGTWSTIGSFTETATVAKDAYRVVGVRDTGDPIEWTLRSYLEDEGGWFTYRRKGWQVVYAAGFVLADMPDEIVQATLHAATFFKNRRLDAASSARDIGDGSVSLDRSIDDLVDDVRQTCRRFISQRVA